MLRKINRHCTARQNRAAEPCVDLLKTPEPRTAPTEFLKNMVTYTPPNPTSLKSPFQGHFKKVYYTPPY